MDLDTIGISLHIALCFTQKLSKLIDIEKHSDLPIGTVWFDSYIEFDAGDADDNENVYVRFRLMPYDDDDNKLMPISICLGICDRKELKDYMIRIANSL